MDNIFNHTVKLNKNAIFSFNIMLIGFMGVGKTTVSSYLKKILNMQTVDTDALIEEKEGLSISEIFEKYGESYFRDSETNILIELQKRKQIIVSCGGGIVLRDENIKIMKANAKVILLTANP